MTQQVNHLSSNLNHSKYMEALDRHIQDMTDFRKNSYF